MKVKDSQPPHVAKVGTVCMNVLTESWIRYQTSRHGRVLATRDRTGKARVDRTTTHPDQPSASSHINDNYCVDKLQERLLARSK